ncbi:amidophosphoribosyltransferase [Bacteroidia bacterium]|nr:amidophosphoribosyltransferase [Bacteroidia bacterium]
MFPFQAFIDLLYPPLCTVCKKTLVQGEEYICSFCLAEFPFSDAVFTKELPFSEGCKYPEAIHTLFYYNKFSKYSGLILAVKYASRQKLGLYLGRMLGEKMGTGIFDGIIPVPLHPKKEKKRGFNQSYQIALGIASVLHTDIWNNVLVRQINNPTQTGKNSMERAQNVANVFALSNGDGAIGKHVLLVDDVITTGATLCSCIEALSPVEGLRVSIGCLGQTE